MEAKIILTAIAAIFFTSCNHNNVLSDAYGNFEAKETIISSESAGKIKLLTIEDGETIKANQVIAIIDTTQLHLQKMQLIAQKDAVKTKISIYNSQANIYKEQLKTLLIEKERLTNLLKDGAVTTQKMDEIDGKENVINSQIAVINSQKSSVYAELSAIDTQIAQINDQIKRCYVINPINGTVLEKYIEKNELAVPGKPLYKIADISSLELRAYISGNQLSSIKIGQKVYVLIDKENNELETLEGVISWISSSSEFTPKVIQTHEERVNLVYAFKVIVANDGSLKIGMPGEVKF